VLPVETFATMIKMDIKPSTLFLGTDQEVNFE